MNKYGRYQVLKWLGGGGMADVYLAEDTLLGRKVALKVIRALVSSREKGEFQRRFYREAQVMAKLSHRAIVPLYDFGEQDGRPFIVMRLMEGGSLSELLQQKGRFSLAEAIQLFERLAPAVDLAHQMDLVHRDLKPDNILLDRDQNPYIADFGIVKLLTATIPTKTGSIGTAKYMSPEQALGGKGVDHRTDIYALGVILVELLTGQHPYAESGLTPIGFALKHINEPIPNICALNSALPTECQTVIECALAKEQEERYNSVGEFVQALKALQAPKQPVVPQLTAVDYLKRGHTAYKQKDYELATIEYSEALRLRPSYINAYMSRGNAYYQRGEYGLAIDDYNQTLQVKPNYAAAYYWRGRAKQAQGKLPEAIADYTDALQINPNFAGAYYQRGLAQQEMGQLPFALADYEAALRANPKHKNAKQAQQAVQTLIQEAQAREAERKRKEEEERKRKAEEERRRKEEEERKRKAEAERKRKEEEERKRKAEEAERKRKAEEAERKRKAEAERKRKAEAERKRKAEEARQREEQRVRMVALLNDDAALKKLPKEQQIKIYVNLLRNASWQEALPAKRRAQLGVELAEVMTIDGMEFCYVPPGPFWMGSNEGEDNAKPLHKVDLDYGYWIGRYPVTNAQYQAFANDGGYRNPAFWQEAQAQGYWKEGKTKDWGDWRDAPHNYRTPFTLPNHPRVGITWYEALAFTRWLSQKWPGTRLPTEAEWEKAARGGLEIPTTPLICPATSLAPLSSQRLTSNHSALPEPVEGELCRNPLAQRSYPWGNSFDANFSNCSETGIKHTNAVGIFSMAKSPYGVEEMSGNVWEWCQSQWVNYDYSPNDGRERLDKYAGRVLRGGSYYENKVLVRLYFPPLARPARQGRRPGDSGLSS